MRWRTRNKCSTPTRGMNNSTILVKSKDPDSAPLLAISERLPFYLQALHYHFQIFPSLNLFESSIQYEGDAFNALYPKSTHTRLILIPIFESSSSSSSFFLYRTTLCNLNFFSSDKYIYWFESNESVTNRRVEVLERGSRFFAINPDKRLLLGRYVNVKIFIISYN